MRKLWIRPLRYEDIIDPADKSPGLLRRIWRFLFLITHEDEAKRYIRDVEADVAKRYGSGVLKMRNNPREEIRKLHKERCRLRKMLYAERAKQRELGGELDYVKGLLNQSGGAT